MPDFDSFAQVEDVITQVTRRELVPPGNRPSAYPKAAEQDGVDSRITWRTKLRSLLCCLAPPQNDQYFRSNEAEAVVIRPPRAALPPPGAPGAQHALCLWTQNTYQVTFDNVVCNMPAIHKHPINTAQCACSASSAAAQSQLFVGLFALL